MSAYRRAVLLAVLLAAGPAAAQPTPAPAAQPSSQADVVVTGTLEREQEVRDFVRALTPGPANGQLARFEDSICPGVFGLSGPLREAVLSRMRRVSEAAGLRIATGDCRPNVLLMVTRDKRALIQALVNSHPHFFGEEENSPRRILAEPGAAAAWHATAELNADGRALPAQGGFRVNQTTRQPGRITEATRPAFFAAAVVVERQALAGLSVNQLADYALMRALARTDPHQLPPASPRSNSLGHGRGPGCRGADDPDPLGPGFPARSLCQPGQSAHLAAARRDSDPRRRGAGRDGAALTGRARRPSGESAAGGRRHGVYRRAESL